MLMRSETIRPMWLVLFFSYFTWTVQGVLPNMLKLAPAAGISWFMFEEVKKMLGVDVRS